MTARRAGGRALWWLLALVAVAALGFAGGRRWSGGTAADAQSGASAPGGTQDGPDRVSAAPGASGPGGGSGAPGGAEGRRQDGPPAGGKRGGDANRPQPVVVETARSGSLRVIQPAVGTVTPLATVTVRTRVDGTLDKLLFNEGDVVKAGQPLALIDPRAYDVALQQAKGQLARDEALLANARVDLERYRGLLAQDSIARQQVDTQAALVRQYEATVQVDKAAVASAELNLSYTRITAPVAGRIGLRQVDAGNIVRTSDSDGLVVITQLAPISVLFSIPESVLPRVRAALAVGKPLVAEAWDRDQRNLLATGSVTTLDNLIDTSTGTVRLRARFTNADGALFPNQFVNLRLVVDALDGATLVPTAAILRGSQGAFVYRVGEDKSVAVVPVRAGASEGENTAIESGLKPGDVVVIEGTDKLREGAKVDPVPRATAASAGAEAPKRKHEGGKPQ